eukprot:705716-Hanusia_phi.AAC.1
MRLKYLRYSSMSRTGSPVSQGGRPYILRQRMRKRDPLSFHNPPPPPSSNLPPPPPPFSLLYLPSLH